MDWLGRFYQPQSGSTHFRLRVDFRSCRQSESKPLPWAQNVVSIGLLKQVKGRWACLFWAFVLLTPSHDRRTKETAKIKGQVAPFQSKLTQAAELLIAVAGHFASTPMLAVTDSWFGNQGLWKPVRQTVGERFHLLSRLRSNQVLYALPDARSADAKTRGRPRKYGQRLGTVTDRAHALRQQTAAYQVNLYGKVREVLAVEKTVMLKTLKCPIKVVWVFRKTQWVALFTTDLDLSVTQVIEYYGARWKIESGFKELKQDIGSQKCQSRNAQAVINHLHFCMMATTVTWMYADRIKADPQRRHKVKGRTSFAFSDVRRLIAEASLSEDFDRLCHKPTNPMKNSLVAVLLRMVA
ncbi:IS701 family transposase [Methylomarinum roseum]|uniref:IS701 family transposase n=1 Tax=Methylomarinum roseum TaxID=3067653 RepID=UPI003D7DE042